MQKSPTPNSTIGTNQSLKRLDSNFFFFFFFHSLVVFVGYVSMLLPTINSAIDCFNRPWWEFGGNQHGHSWNSTMNTFCCCCSDSMILWSNGFIFALETIFTRRRSFSFGCVIFSCAVVAHPSYYNYNQFAVVSGSDISACSQHIWLHNTHRHELVNCFLLDSINGGPAISGNTIKLNCLILNYFGVQIL